jgi:hypothetical protein
MVKASNDAASTASASVEEASSLLSNENQVAMRQQKAKKTLLKVLGAVALVATGVIGVTLAGSSNNENAIVSMETKYTTATKSHGVAAPAVMESQFGWDDVTNGWCSVRAYTTCLLYSDEEKCRKEIRNRCTTKKAVSTDASGSSDDGENAPTREKTTHSQTEVPQYTKPAEPVEEDGVGRRLLRIL